MEIYDFLGTCVSYEIAQLAEKRGRKSSYKKAVKMIYNYSKELYNELALNLRNPWEDNTNIKTIKGQKILHIVHSQTDYLFLIK